jgi:hypothetical protein
MPATDPLFLLDYTVIIYLRSVFWRIRRCRFLVGMSCVYDVDTNCIILLQKKTKQTSWSESANELYRPSDRRLSAK